MTLFKKTAFFLYNKSMEKCKICGKECRNVMQLSLHAKFKHSLRPKEYYDKYLRKPDEGICPVCGKETTFDGIRDGYRKYCRPCTFKDKSVKEKLQKSLIEKHGGIGFASKEISASVENTCLEKYGVRNYSQTEEYSRKVKDTLLQKYGKESYFQTEEGKKRIREGWTQNYGGVGFASQEFQNKHKQLMLEKHGVENYAQSEEYHQRYPGILNKRLNTMREHKTFRSSKMEKKLEAKLRELFPDLKTQYKSELYPFKCDFYIPSLDLYIEYNGTWTHGYKFFDKNDENDIIRLNELKEKVEKSKFYTIAIEIWTVRDVLKLETAIKNNLNYVAWFNEEQANDWIEAQKKIRVV